MLLLAKARELRAEAKRRRALKWLMRSMIARWHCLTAHCNPRVNYIDKCYG
jgi:hypothetical protein